MKDRRISLWESDLKHLGFSLDTPKEKLKAGIRKKLGLPLETDNAFNIRQKALKKLGLDIKTPNKMVWEKILNGKERKN